MKSLQRRHFICATAVLVLGARARTPSFLAQAAQEAPVIEIVARRFRYEPNQIAVKARQRVVLAIRSLDFVHGFTIPDLGVRADLVPGKIARVEVIFKAPGVIDFLCDNFCGDGHEDMRGRFIVT